jgi:hypothetical protein
VHRALILRRIRPFRTLRAQNSTHYISDPGKKKRSDQYAAPHEHANRGEGYQELRPPVHDGRYGLPDMDVDMSRFEGRNTRLSPRVVEGPPHGFNDVYSGFEELWRSMAWG